MKKRKLSLKKESIAKLSTPEMRNVKGGTEWLNTKDYTTCDLDGFTCRTQAVCTYLCPTPSPSLEVIEQTGNPFTSDPCTC